MANQPKLLRTGGDQSVNFKLILDILINSSIWLSMNISTPRNSSKLLSARGIKGVTDFGWEVLIFSDRLLSLLFKNCGGIVRNNRLVTVF